MIDLKHEIKRELDLTNPPDLWERIQADADNHDIDAGPLPIDARHWRRRPGWLAAVAAVTILLALVVLKALPGTDSTVDTGPAVTAPPTTLTLDALEDAEQFRVANITVTVQCTATKSTPDSAMRDLVLGGVVVDNPDNRRTLDGVSVAVGDLLALIIREDPGRGDLGRRLTLYDNTQWFGGATISSCDELVESVPTWVDGGFFNGGIPGGYEILLGTDVPVVPEPSTDDGPTTLARGEGVEIGGFSPLTGRTLNLDAVEQDGEVTGEFRVDDVVITLECADTAFYGHDLILGGQVSDDPDGQGLVYTSQGGELLADGSFAFSGEESVAVGDLVALVIREDRDEDGPGRQRVTLYAGESIRDNDHPGSCTELVESIPNLDGGYFNDVAGDIETNLLPLTPPCDEWTEREVTSDDLEESGCSDGRVLAAQEVHDCTDGRVLYWNEVVWGYVGERAHAHEDGAETVAPDAERAACGY